MTYDRYRFTYGIKTTSEINSLTGISEGQSVWNSVLKKPEYVINFSGTLLWTNEDCVIMRNVSGSTMVEGNIVRLSLSTTSPVSYGTTLCGSGFGEDDTVYGVVFRGGANNSLVVVATQGSYNVLMQTTATAVRGDLVIPSSTPGRGEKVVTSGGVAGMMAVMLQTLNNSQLAAQGYLVKCLIQNFSAY